MTKKIKLPDKFIPPWEIAGIPEDTPVLAAFSGGADSSALLHMLYAYSEQSGGKIKIYAAHLNHMIRGKEADRDEDFCRSVAEKYNISFFTEKIDVPALAKERNIGIETAAREARYGFFERIMKGKGIPLLVTAHIAEDNLETIIMNLARGAGLSGISGIPPERLFAGGTIVRPVLGIEKSEIIEYCRQNGIDFVIDSTNADTEIARNFVRKNILPQILALNSGAVGASVRLASSLREDSLCLDGLAMMFIEEASDDGGVDCEKLNTSPSAIVNRVISRLYRNISGGMLEYCHIKAIRELCAAEKENTFLCLPDGIFAAITQKKLIISNSPPQKAELPSYNVTINNGKNFISQINCEIISENSHCHINIYKNSILLFLDSDKINGEIFARNRLPGDKLSVCGVNKSIKKLLCDLKIPLETRYRLPVICDASGIIAVPFAGVRDDIFVKKNNPDGKNILTLEFVMHR